MPTRLGDVAHPDRRVPAPAKNRAAAATIACARSTHPPRRRARGALDRWSLASSPPQLALEDLALRVDGQLGDEVDRLRHLVDRQPLPAEGDQRRARTRRPAAG